MGRSDLAVGGAAPAVASLQSKILKIFETTTIPEMGLHVNRLVELLGNVYSRQDVKSAVEHLTDEGMMYATCDDEHFSKA